MTVPKYDPVKCVVRSWKRGNSMGIVIPAMLRREMGLKDDTLFKVTITASGDKILLTPCGVADPSMYYHKPRSKEPEVEVHISGTKPGSTEIFPAPIPEPGIFKKLLNRIHL